MNRSLAAAGSGAFFLAAPGTVAGLIPWLVTGWRLPEVSAAELTARTVLAGVAIGTAAAVLVAAFVRFVHEGRGTPAPVAPTDQLVVGGSYRYVRNPMYLAVVLILLGQTVLFASIPLLVYAVIAWAVMAAFVRLYEEPLLEERYGAQYDAYRRNVRGWWPRLRPWSGERTG